MYLKEQSSGHRDGGQRTQSGRQQIVLSPQISSEEMQVGSFYEINHAMLAPTAKYPDQLKLVRVVMVSEKTGVSISLRFPSIYSLRNHFNNSSSNKTREGTKKLPPLDEKYVMCSDVACQLLLRRVSASEFAEKKDSWSFWAVDSSGSPTVSITTSSPPPPPPPAAAAAANGINTLLAKKGLCWSELKCREMLRWGKRRQVRFLSRYEETNYNLNLQSLSVGDSDRGILKDVLERGKEVEEDSCSEREENGKKTAASTRAEGLKEAEEEAEEEEEEDAEERTDGEDREEESEEQKQGEWTPKRASRGTEARRRSSRKRKSCGTSRTLKINRAKRDTAKKQVGSHASKKKQKMIKASIDRWSAERYKLAEQNMLKILKEKGAVYGNPILRPALRLEARKLIGDTGLLDHLLKHMAGKVAPGGTERFRRRHNADGAMEYWLESADLMNIRKEAGIQDPYWTPPAGWKPGDSPSQDPVCAKEIKFLMKEIAKLKEEMQELISKKQEESRATMTSKPSDREKNGLSLSLKDMYTELLRKKSAMEEQFKEISEYLRMMKLMQENMGLVKSNVEDTKTTDLEEPITPAGTEGGERMMVGQEKNEAAGDAVAGAVPRDEPQGDKVEENMKMTAAAAEDKATRIQRLKSGFRICKPQGTFLWPDMVVSSSPSPQFAVEDLLVVPTPAAIPSSPPSHRHHHQTSNGGLWVGPPSPPVKPLAEKRSVSLAATTNDMAQTKASDQNPSMSHYTSHVTKEDVITDGSASPLKDPSFPSLVQLGPSEGTTRTANATLVINLNEPPNSTNGASSLTYKRRYQSFPAASASDAISSSVIEEAVRQLEGDDDGDGDDAEMNQQLKKKQKKQLSSSPSPEPSPCVSVGAGPSWLALATSPMPPPRTALLAAGTTLTSTPNTLKD